MQIFDGFFGMLGQAWDGFNRMHRGGLGESPRGLSDYRRNRLIVAVALVLCGVASVVMWFIWRL
ncbi:MAG: hypothetical protein NTU45_03690 [Planctomycetota bacterium]|nr:hypothetical protein [Planctomycetota bacterium]